jgi:hypothetical protein
MFNLISGQFHMAYEVFVLNSLTINQLPIELLFLLFCNCEKYVTTRVLRIMFVIDLI